MYSVPCFESSWTMRLSLGSFDNCLRILVLGLSGRQSLVILNVCIRLLRLWISRVSWQLTSSEYTCCTGHFNTVGCPSHVLEHFEFSHLDLVWLFQSSQLSIVLWAVLHHRQCQFDPFEPDPLLPCWLGRNVEILGVHASILSSRVSRISLRFSRGVLSCDLSHLPIHHSQGHWSWIW